MTSQNKHVLVFCKNPAVISANIESLRDNALKPGAHGEVLTLGQQFREKGYAVSFSHLGGFDEDKRTLDIYDSKSGDMSTLPLSGLDKVVNGILFRTVGSLELQRDKIKSFMAACKEDFKGVVMNAPNVVSSCLRKDYLKDLEKEGFVVPHSDYYPNTVGLSDLLGRYSDRDLSKLVVKPVTGEVSNSVAMLNAIDEGFFTHKGPKVGGWIVQNLIEEIWQGENQLVYIGDKFSHAFSKKYNRTEKSGLVPTRQDLDNTTYVNYSPTSQEFRAAEAIRKCLSSKLGLTPAISRIDFVNTDPKPPVIMEVEMVNPEIIAHDCNSPAKAREIYGKVVEVFTSLCINRDELRQDGNLEKL